MEKKKENFLKKAFRDMAESARAQHEVDKANLQAVKAESKANFEENRGSNSLKRAKAQSKASWEEAHLTPAQRKEKQLMEQQRQIEEANERIRLASERVIAAKAQR